MSEFTANHSLFLSCHVDLIAFVFSADPANQEELKDWWCLNPEETFKAFRKIRPDGESKDAYEKAKKEHDDLRASHWKLGNEMARFVNQCARFPDYRQAGPQSSDISRAATGTTDGTRKGVPSTTNLDQYWFDRWSDEQRVECAGVQYMWRMYQAHRHRLYDHRHKPATSGDVGHWDAEKDSTYLENEMLGDAADLNAPYMDTDGGRKEQENDDGYPNHPKHDYSSKLRIIQNTQEAAFRAECIKGIIIVFVVRFRFCIVGESSLPVTFDSSLLFDVLR
jgi:hypothetical protein